MAEPILRQRSLKPLSPKGDLGVRNNESIRVAFPHPIKNSGKGLVSSQAFKGGVKSPGQIGAADYGTKATH